MTANNSRVAQLVDVDSATLRNAIKDEYREVAEHPGKGFHSPTGRRLTKIVGYRDEWFEGVSELAIESLAGNGNPFAMGELAAGEKVVDVGSGGGIDSLVAARMVGRALMQDAERRLRDTGCPKINLQIRSANAAVVVFYGALGYDEDAVVSMGKRLEHD
jgi:GNAT superfamily N-acetyltransferase